MNNWQTLGTIAVVALALGLALVVQATPTNTSSSTGTSTSTSSVASTSTTTTDSTSTGSTGAHGLELLVSVNQTSIGYGKSFGLTVSEYNTLSSTNNVSVSSQWIVPGATQSCPSQFYPFGISVYQGHYAADNVTQGTAIQVFPITACPMLVRLITGYDFLPQSIDAQILPASGNETTSMLVYVAVGVNYAGLGYSGQGSPLSPGAYTLVASDEWGNLAFLYVTVQ